MRTSELLSPSAAARVRDLEPFRARGRPLRVAADQPVNFEARGAQCAHVRQATETSTDDDCPDAHVAMCLRVERVLPALGECECDSTGDQ